MPARSSPATMLVGIRSLGWALFPRRQVRVGAALTEERRACVRVGRPRSFIAAREDVANRRSALGLLHEHKPPWLAVANRGREPSETKQLAKNGGIDWLAAEASDGTPPR